MTTEYTSALWQWALIFIGMHVAAACVIAPLLRYWWENRR